MKYYVRKGTDYMASGKPLTLEDIKAMLRLGKIDVSWQFRSESEATWKDVGSVSGTETDKQFVISAKNSGHNSESPSQVIELLQDIVGNQQEQIRQLRAIRWGLALFALWLFFVGFLFQTSLFK